ncbi:hypothetical protein [Streptomyces sp. ISL-100]|uniref:hypothetical protein n=1 Tax=Streptomyces sp. ISL-100 TaxID=2819173 RepID=UPI001BE9E30F|nr:hypothetical protein [Streptomyces sp. ISL-100]MBT2396451.1 hypothetical protein [Streptomyces sp. ISL-100]
MGWFTRHEPKGVMFDSVIADGVIGPTYTDDDGVLCIDADDDLEVIVDGAIVDGTIYDAWVEDNGRIVIDLES